MNFYEYKVTAIPRMLLKYLFMPWPGAEVYPVCEVEGPAVKDPLHETRNASWEYDGYDSGLFLVDHLPPVCDADCSLPQLKYGEGAGICRLVKC